MNGHAYVESHRSSLLGRKAFYTYSEFWLPNDRKAMTYHDSS